MSQPTPIFQARSAKLFTIGQVLNELTPEFQDLTQSKLRFLRKTVWSLLSAQILAIVNLATKMLLACA